LSRHEASRSGSATSAPVVRASFGWGDAASPFVSSRSLMRRSPKSCGPTCAAGELKSAFSSGVSDQMHPKPNSDVSPPLIRCFEYCGDREPSRKGSGGGPKSEPALADCPVLDVPEDVRRRGQVRVDAREAVGPGGHQRNID